MKTKIKIGDSVRITKTEVNYALHKIGTVTGFREGGFEVKIPDAPVPKSGVIPKTEKEPAIVWAAEVEKAE
jgi:hypothetical protein